MFTTTYNCQILLFLVISFYSSQQSAFKFPVGIENERGDTWILDTGGGASCVELKDCSTFSWLMNRKYVQNEVIQLHPRRITRFLRNKKCSIDEIHSNRAITLKTRVICPHQNAHDLNPNYSDYVHANGEKNDAKESPNAKLRENDDANDCYEQNDGRRLGDGLSVKLATAEIECSLEMTHGDQRTPLSSLETERFSGHGRVYQRLRKLEIQRRTVFVMTVHGNCCWNIFEQPLLKGETHRIEPGDSVYPRRQPRSIQKICCPAAI